MVKLFRKGKKEAPDTALCMNIYPKENGGVKYERMPVSSINPAADRWRKVEDNNYYYLQAWDSEKNALVPYYPLPEVITVSSDWVARVLSCPYIKLKRLKTGVLGHLANWIPVIVLGLAILFIVIMMG